MQKAAAIALGSVRVGGMRDWSMTDVDGALDSTTAEIELEMPLLLRSSEVDAKPWTQQVS